MADTVGDPHFSGTLTLHLRIRRVVDSSGAAAIDIAKIEGDVDIANTVWNQYGISVVADSIEDWESDKYFQITDDRQSGSNEFKQLEEEHWTYGQAWINVYYVETWERINSDGTVSSGVNGQCSYPGPQEAHAIGLEDVEALSDQWRGLALAHEIGHYLWLKHTKDDDCSDTDTASPDSGNLMSQAGDGRTDVVADIHLTECQVKKARYSCFSDRASLFSPFVAALTG